MILGASRYLLEALLCHYVGGMMKFIYMFLVGTVFIYLLCAFLELHIDFTLQKQGVRFTFCVLDCAVAFVTLAFYQVESHSQ